MSKFKPTKNANLSKTLNSKIQVDVISKYQVLWTTQCLVVWTRKYIKKQWFVAAKENALMHVGNKSKFIKKKKCGLGTPYSQEKEKTTMQNHLPCTIRKPELCISQLCITSSYKLISPKINWWRYIKKNNITKQSKMQPTVPAIYMPSKISLCTAKFLWSCIWKAITLWKKEVPFTKEK